MTHKYCDPFKLRLQKNLAEGLRTITPENGYVNDLSAGTDETERIFRGRATFGDDDPIPMVSILEPPVPPDPIQSPESSTATKGAYELLLQGWAVDDVVNPTDPGHVLLADVKRYLALERAKTRARDNDAFGMGGLVIDIEIAPGTVRPADNLSAKAYFWLRLTLIVVEDHENPYD